MVSALDPATAGEPPHPHDFSEQLILQLYEDLDGFLFDGSEAVDNAWPLVVDAVRAGRMRGAVPLVFARATLAAHHRLVFDEPPPDESLALDAAGDAIASFLSEARAQLPALKNHAERLTRQMAIAEQSPDAIHVPLSQTIQRFYVALGQENAAAGSRALIEMRSIILHLDACAMMLDQAESAPEPIRVIRPDRFHDYFMHYASLARTPDSARGERPLATLAEGGRITAVITEDQHPLEAAATAVRATIHGDDTTRDHALVRIRALLEVLDGLRRAPNPLLGDAVGDDTVHLSLVLAAATAPLSASSGFRFPAIAQIARFNQHLLRRAAAVDGAPH
ncbi:hypothetical protein [Nevskia sp.]|uniref:hypothetical protein n=1 Tax=Nevskia sp. TaxID=1929292 RepID=UPI0025D315B7|nr:hypothetical protein [Nevskia sp.]